MKILGSLAIVDKEQDHICLLYKFIKILVSNFGDLIPTPRWRQRVRPNLVRVSM